MSISYFMKIQGSQDESPNQRWALFTKGIIFSDLMSVKQRLILTFISVQWKRVNYFVQA
jgi:hypothetical protein